MKLNLITPAFTLLLGIFLCASSVKAQDVPQDHQAHFGIKVGLNTSGFTGDIGPFDKNSPGYANGPFATSSKDVLIDGFAGVTADIRISKSFSFSTELLFNATGGQYKIRRDDVILTDTSGNQTSGYDHYNYEIVYAELPVMLQYHLPINDNHISYRIYAGISPAIKLSAKSNYEYYSLAADSVTENTNSSESKVNYVRGFEVNPIAGFWMSSKNPGHGLKLFGDIRFEYTGLPVFERSSDADGSNLQTHMWSFLFGFGVRF